MRIKRIAPEFFRSILPGDDTDWECGKPVALLVGENNAGKTNFFRAVEAVRSGAMRPTAYYQGEVNRPLRVVLQIEVDRTEARHLAQGILGIDLDSQGFRGLYDELGSEITLYWEPQLGGTGSWGSVSITRRVGVVVELKKSGGRLVAPAPTFWESVRARGSLIEIARQVGTDSDGVQIRPQDMCDFLYSWVRPQIIPIAEIRQLPGGSNVDATLSPTGQQVADVLFTLKNSPRAESRRRFVRIQEEFAQLNPSLKLDVIRRSASAPPEVVVEESDSELALSVDEVGSGIGQLITILTNLIGLEKHVILLDSPESNLHPLAIVKVRQLIEEFSKRNQVLVATHSPYMIAWNMLAAVARVANEGGATVVRQPEPGAFSDADLHRLRPQLEHGLREMLFGRAALFVEGPTEAGAFPVFAAHLGRPFEGLGVVVVRMDGSSSYLGVKLAKSFRLPSLVVLDRDTIEKVASRRTIDGISIPIGSALVLGLSSGILKEDDLRPLAAMIKEDLGVPPKVITKDLASFAKSVLERQGVLILPADFEGVLRGGGHGGILDEAQGSVRSKAVAGAIAAQMIVDKNGKIPTPIEEIVGRITGLAER